jgi:histidine triad (HIT) family protein
MEDSIFTKIIKGDIPCHKIYEDDLTIAFLDIHPIKPGHTLVVPKEQVDHLWDLPDESYTAVMNTAKRVANKIREVTGAARVGVHVVGLDVPHAHVHLFPFNTVEEYRTVVDMNIEPDHSALAAMAKKLAF